LCISSRGRRRVVWRREFAVGDERDGVTYDEALERVLSCWAGRDVMVGMISVRLEGEADGGMRTWIRVWIFIHCCREFYFIVFFFRIGLD